MRRRGPYRRNGTRATAFNSAEKASRPDRFLNRRAQAFWALRDELREGRIDRDSEDEELAAQLLAIRWTVNSRGQIQIESKDEMRKRGLPSPDRADAVAMALDSGPTQRAIAIGGHPARTALTPMTGDGSGSSTKRKRRDLTPSPAA